MHLGPACHALIHSKSSTTWCRASPSVRCTEAPSRCTFVVPVVTLVDLITVAIRVSGIVEVEIVACVDVLVEVDPESSTAALHTRHVHEVVFLDRRVCVGPPREPRDAREWPPVGRVREAEQRIEEGCIVHGLHFGGRV